MMKWICLYLLLPLQLFAQQLYVIHGRSAVVEDDRFILHDVDRSVVYFSQGEDRHAGAMPIQEFVMRWEREAEFGKSGADAHYVSYVAWKTHFNEKPVHLTYPRYNRADETLTFTIKGDREKSKKLGEVALYLIYE